MGSSGAVKSASIPSFMKVGRTVSYGCRWRAGDCVRGWLAGRGRAEDSRGDEEDEEEEEEDDEKEEEEEEDDDEYEVDEEDEDDEDAASITASSELSKRPSAASILLLARLLSSSSSSLSINLFLFLLLFCGTTRPPIPYCVEFTTAPALLAVLIAASRASDCATSEKDCIFLPSVNALNITAFGSIESSLSSSRKIFLFLDGKADIVDEICFNICDLM